MIIKVYAWIPRSFIHIAEIIDKLGKGTKLNISDVEENGYINFKIKEYKDYKDLSFTLDGDGLYSVSVKLPDGNAEKKTNDFYKTVKELIINEIIKTFHRVTYIQIIEGVLPINYCTITLSKKDEKIIGYERIKAGSINIYNKRKESYINDSFIFVSGSVSSDIEGLCDYYAFTNIASHFFFEMMNKMEQYHTGTKEVIRLLEYEPNSELINNAYLNLDLVKKDASESWAKVEQAIDCLNRKNASFNSIKVNKQLELFIDKSGVNHNFIKLDADKDYISSLWNLLINHLGYVDTAVEARINYKHMKNNYANQWLGLINSGFILGSIVLSIYLLGLGLFQNLTNFMILLVSWIVFYEIVNYFVLKRNK